MDVYVDGSKIATINENGALQFQKTYTSPVYLPGIHEVQFKNPVGSSSYIDVDEIEIR